MSYAHLHLLVNHLPVIGPVFGLGLFLFALWRGSNELIKASLGVFVVIGAVAIAVYFTGDPAAHEIRNLPDYSREITHRHEDAALIATIATGVFGAVSLWILYVFRGRPVSTSAARLALLGGIVVAGLMAYTALLGGQVRHTEIRPGYSVRTSRSTLARVS